MPSYSSVWKETTHRYFLQGKGASMYCTLLTWSNIPYISENVFCFHLVHAGQHCPAQPLLSWPRCRPVIIIILIRLALLSSSYQLDKNVCISLKNMYRVSDHLNVHSINSKTNCNAQKISQKCLNSLTRWKYQWHLQHDTLTTHGLTLANREECPGELLAGAILASILYSLWQDLSDP